jgi:hypothetical protein
VASAGAFFHAGEQDRSVAASGDQTQVAGVVVACLAAGRAVGAWGCDAGSCFAALAILSASFVREYARNLDCVCALTSAGIASRGISRRSSGAVGLARHGSSRGKPGKVGMVKTRLTRWFGRWRERRLVREQTKQTSGARQAKRAAEGQRWHSTGHGP